MLPFLIVGVVANALAPSAFSVDGPPEWLRVASIIMLILGLAIWAWSVVLIISRVPRGQLITEGPFALVKHPLYTSVALLVLPWVGFLLNTWLGAAIGLILYASSRKYEPEEEAELARKFKPEWEQYRQSVKFPWL